MNRLAADNSATVPAYRSQNEREKCERNLEYKVSHMKLTCCESDPPPPLY